MKQLDVVVNPPAFVWDPSLTLTNVTFDPDVLDSVLDISDAKSNGSKGLNFYLVNYFLVTDRQRDRQKAMNKSSPCENTAGLKNGYIFGD